jgi:hypothetical protein
VSTKAKKEKPKGPFLADDDWWKKDISNPEVFKREYGTAEKILDSLIELDRREETKAKDVELANTELEMLAEELELERQERQRRYGNRFPLVYERLAPSKVSENTMPRRLGRPQGSKNRPK